MSVLSLGPRYRCLGARLDLRIWMSHGNLAMPHSKYHDTIFPDILVPHIDYKDLHRTSEYSEFSISRYSLDTTGLEVIIFGRR